MKLVFASNNKHKIAEIQNMLPEAIQIISLSAIGCYEDIPETADTIEGNAILKADYVTKNFGYDCFADDSGLEVNALGGAPGVYSARYAGEHKNDGDNIEKLLLELNGVSNRKANFKTVIALNYQGKQYVFTGIADGEIMRERRGNLGFGYDPVFVPAGYDQTFAEMAQQEKAQISHRGKATKELINFLTK